MKKPWNPNPKGWAAAGLLAAMLVAAGSANANSVLDAPHNESHNVRCGSCHSYSLWWQFSPTKPGTTEYTGRTDAVCNNCHGTGGSEVHKLSHSSLSMGDAHNPALGNWSTKCIDCHNPHMQQQLNWLSSSATFGDGSLASGLYLAEGTIDTIIDHGDGTTTITFTNGAAKTPWQDTARWNKKSGTTGRGLLLSLGYKTGDKTYEIINASDSVPLTNGAGGNGAGSITVQSGGDPVDALKYTGTNFGIIYGQLVKASITTPNSGAKPVKFFDPQDGFVDSASGAATQAICQVCHTQTTYWRNDGTLAIHNDGSVCTSCHTIAAGFKPNYPDHDTFIARLTACGSCHTQAKVVDNIHRFNCSTCHAAGGPPALKTADINTPFRQDPPVWTPTNSPPALGNCGECHGADYFNNHRLKTSHAGQVDKAAATCTSACHYHDKADTVTDIHKGTCTHCHNMTPNADGSFGEKVSLAAQYGPGNCTNCHRTIAANWRLGHPKANDHAAQVDQDPVGGFAGLIDGRTVNRPDCATCHTGSTDFDIHWSRTCATCHAQYTGALYGRALKGPGTCSTCHIEVNYDAAATISPAHPTPTP
jgi:hypothetical protein